MRSQNRPRADALPRARAVVGLALAVAVGAAGCSSDEPKRVKASVKSASSAHATHKANGRPLVARVVWVPTAGGGSLHVVPTQAGRTDKATTGAAAWIQVQRLAKRAGGKAAQVVDEPGMKAQFVCHWQFARIKEPKKPSWNLEPWRPVVSEKAMIDARCNPGGAEGADQ